MGTGWGGSEISVFWFLCFWGWGRGGDDKDEALGAPGLGLEELVPVVGYEDDV